MPVPEQGGLKIRFPSGSVGSSPTSGTRKIPANKHKMWDKIAAQHCTRTSTTPTGYTNALREGLFHRFRGLAAHVGQDVRISVERYGDGSVAEHLGDYLGVDVPAEKQRSARVRKIVEVTEDPKKPLRIVTHSTKGLVIRVRGSMIGSRPFPLRCDQGREKRR
jgi:hypothetical protein